MAILASPPYPVNPRQNHLLAAIPEDEFNRISPMLERVHLALGEIISEAGSKTHFIYFPTTAIVSLLNVLDDGSTAEIAVVGREGIIGIAIFMGGASMLSRALVQSEGAAYRMPGDLLKREFDRNPAMQHLFMRYIMALLAQMAQTAICNRDHSIDQQLSRWLLLSIDRLSGNVLNMTQELIADMLGVRREGVTEAARKLQDAGLISYSRGCLTVLDRPGLEARVCECYEVVKDEFERLLPDVIAI
ncbi:MAG: Crp/Fnr family transcriptional regulator [Candidatus Melainabacteria bacterium HGW-Melainabacteria-1]|nr:MAG: Crp/Fnr family transcriptional regulator [Candidatus Melainabacteria bacterium HGW-Melainabacteria-1]